MDGNDGEIQTLDGLAGLCIADGVVVVTALVVGETGAIRPFVFFASALCSCVVVGGDGEVENQCGVAQAFSTRSCNGVLGGFEINAVIPAVVAAIFHYIGTLIILNDGEVDGANRVAVVDFIVDGVMQRL